MSAIAAAVGLDVETRTHLGREARHAVPTCTEVNTFYISWRIYASSPGRGVIGTSVWLLPFAPALSACRPLSNQIIQGVQQPPLTQRQRDKEQHTS